MDVIACILYTHILYFIGKQFHISTCMHIHTRMHVGRCLEAYTHTHIHTYIHMQGGLGDVVGAAEGRAAPRCETDHYSGECQV